MFRIRRKFLLILCAAFVSVVLFLYLMINNSFPPEKQQNLQNIEKKLKQLENGLNQHQEEMGRIKQQIQTIHGKPSETEQEEYQSLDGKPALSKKELFKDVIINADNLKTCPIITDSVPQPDIQMLSIYNELPFDNPDGGPWKQGWKVSYDPMQFNKHHKLKVFVVPHSHNDPGWIKTFNDYYEHDTKHILSNMLRHLSENEGMTFIWAEISYFSVWFHSLSKKSIETVQKLVKNRQLEFVTGGWVMPDEANSHWLSILMQLTEGQMWLKKNLNVTPTSSWSIDPFGQSATMPYLLKESGMQNLLIQRTHYSIKKRLAQQRQLEFRWRQVWDATGETELFTHMMPFYSYDIPHTCGPDPKVCCQFDFKRLPGFGLTCPWKIAPQAIDDLNVANRAELIVDQWRKKSVLYRTRSVIIPLGDDFRYSQSTEWEAQRKNYEKLFDYINNKPSLFTEAKFATLQEYFDSVRKEKELTEFPTLSGDFFTYADRDDHYWSGYYTSRPYHKRMDRVLLHYIRTAEMLYSWSKWAHSSKLEERLENARQQLSLFQHHDAITGTAKSFVVQDYANRMLQAVKDSKFVIQQSAYRLLTKPTIYAPDYEFNYFHLDDSRWPGPEDSRTTIILGDKLPTKHLVLHNSLPQWREEIVEFFVSKPYVKLTDFDNNPIECQITPVWSWHKSINSITAPQASTTKYRLIFNAKVPPLGLATYIVHSTNPDDKNPGTTYSKITILTDIPFSVNLGDYPQKVEFAKPRELSLHVGNGPVAAFSKYGLLKSMAINEHSQHVPTHLSFLKYGVRHNKGMSGAYLFLPDGPASLLMLGALTVLVSQGPLESSVTTGLPFATHQTILRGGAPEIRNLVDIGNMDNTEIVMRIATNINSEDLFYTDLNGMQIMKRKNYGKLPLQANYYPVPSSIFIEDDTYRFTLLSGQPLGGSSLKSGEIEIMQDRRLAQDDERGLGQGVLDNQPVLHSFRLVLEKQDKCSKPDPEYPGGFLTFTSHRELQTLLHPIDKMIWNENEWVGAVGYFGKDREGLDDGVEIGVLRALPHLQMKNSKGSCFGGVLFKPHLDKCGEMANVSGKMNIQKLFELNADAEIHSAPLTLLKRKEPITDVNIHLCSMDVKAFIVQR